MVYERQASQPRPVNSLARHKRADLPPAWLDWDYLLCYSTNWAAAWLQRACATPITAAAARAHDGIVRSPCDGKRRIQSTGLKIRVFCPLLVREKAQADVAPPPLPFVIQPAPCGSVE